MHPLLNEDWSDYDEYKMCKGRNPNKVACEESWEVNYIAEKLKKHFPDTPDFAIRHAIRRCCNTMEAPRPRVDFIDCVVIELSSWI